jgi:hypothetical protein
MKYHVWFANSLLLSALNIDDADESWNLKRMNQKEWTTVGEIDDTSNLAWDWIAAVPNGKCEIQLVVQISYLEYISTCVCPTINIPNARKRL